MRTLTPTELDALPRRTPRPGIRQQAELRNRELARLDRLGVKASAAIAVKARVAAIRAFQRGEDPAGAIAGMIEPFSRVLIAGMVAGHLTGRLRTMRAAAAWRRRKVKLAIGNPYTDAVRFLQERNKLGAADLKALETAYGPEAANVTRRMSAQVERKIKAATADITKRGLHVRAGVAELRQAFEAAGVTNQSPWLLETLYRTQTAVAYSAGQWQANEDPAIREILWGYEYATANDDRVRPGHVLLDGTRLPTSDPRWTSIRPPNGFNCRCFCIEAFHGDADATPLAPIESATLDDGTVVVAGPDKGFAFNPGRVFADVLKKTATRSGTAAVATAPVVTPTPALTTKAAKIAERRKAVEVVGTPPAADVASLDELLADIPDAAWDETRKAGVTLQHGGGLVSDVRPDLKGVRPRGWGPGETWDNADGLYASDTKKAIAVAKRLGRAGQTLAARPAGDIMAHEFGHAVDHARGINGAAKHSDTNQFRIAYLVDARNVRQAGKAGYYEYLLQGGDAGPQEAFAECFAVTTGRTLFMDAVEVANDWPNVVRYILKATGKMP